MIKFNKEVIYNFIQIYMHDNKVIKVNNFSTTIKDKMTVATTTKAKIFFISTSIEKSQNKL